MSEKIEKNDFVEIEYAGKIKDTNEIFDTNIKEEAKKLNLDIKNHLLIICLGQNMILKSIDEFLIGKELGKYTLELKPEMAFGKRNKDLVRTIPLSVFSRHSIKPQIGTAFSFDGLFGKIIASGSRVIVDFNNPLAGKEVVYSLEVKRKVEDINEKVRALMLAFFRKEFEFELKDKKLIIKTEKNFVKLIELSKEKFKEVLGLELEVREKSEEKEKPDVKK